MKIVVITGSGRKRGSSNYLAEEFIRGAEKAGNKVYRFDAAYKSINPCIGCNRCRESFKCIYDDAFGEIGKEMISADVIVWVTPVYFMTMTAQLKAAIEDLVYSEGVVNFINFVVDSLRKLIETIDFLINNPINARTMINATTETVIII